MIQFNLLPEVKIAYIKAQRTKRMVMAIATLSSAVALFIIVTLFLLINVVQKKYLDDLSNNIKTDTQQLASKPDINKILTVQNQLQALDKAHDQKPVASRLGGYIETLTPSNVSIGKLQVNFVDNTMEITGQADLIANVNKFVDTLKFTKYKVKDVDGEKDAFSQVVLDSFSKTDKAVTYTIKLNFDHAIFDTKYDVSLDVPVTTTSRSVTEKPNALFAPNTTPAKPTGSQ